MIPHVAADSHNAEGAGVRWSEDLPIPFTPAAGAVSQFSEISLMRLRLEAFRRPAF